MAVTLEIGMINSNSSSHQHLLWY